MRATQGGNAAPTALHIFVTDFSRTNGSCVRDYIHVSTLCQANLRARQRLLTDQSLRAEYYNLTDGTGFSVLEVVEACHPIQYLLEDRPAGDPAALVGDARLPAEVLG